MLIVGIVIVLIIVLVIIVLLQFNKLRKLNVNVEEGYAQIEVQLSRRADLILTSWRPSRVRGSRSQSWKQSRPRVHVQDAKGVEDTAAADAQLTAPLTT